MKTEKWLLWFRDVEDFGVFLARGGCPEKNTGWLLPQSLPDYVTEFVGVHHVSQVGVDDLDGKLFKSRYPEHIREAIGPVHLENGEFLAEIVVDVPTSYVPHKYAVGQINNLHELADWLGVEYYFQVSDRLYKDHDVGIFVMPHGVQLTKIVEGVDGERSEKFYYPFTGRAFEEALLELDEWADELWNETHGCFSCGPEDEAGCRPVNPECGECGGKGVPI